ncbi:MAG: nitronate monooxygenase [Chloroflexi bacterium]|nr:nitronate monooxygenase [Chloroflexota bacterium]
MIRTPVCDLLGIDAPIIQAGMSTYTSAELVAAVTNAGALGSLGAANRPVDDLRRQLARIADLTAGSFAVNHLVTVIDEEAFALTLEARPRVISMALDHPHDYVKRAHDAGSLVMHQVTTVQQAVDAAERGVDLIVAQGGEAGGYGGTVGTMTLVPQIVDAVRPLPVIAAGGITDGRGLAAALMFGAQGVNIGTRFLATIEAPIPDGHKQKIVDAASQDAIKADVWNDINPLPGNAGYFTVARALRTPFLDEWQAKRGEVDRERERIQDELMQAGQNGRFHEFMPFAGQSAGAIPSIRSAADIVRDIVAQAEDLLRTSAGLVS